MSAPRPYDGPGIHLNADDFEAPALRRAARAVWNMPERIALALVVMIGAVGAIAIRSI